MSNSVCRSCGYTFKSDDKVCKYCGSSNPSYQASKAKELFSKAFEETFQNKETIKPTAKNNGDINVCLLIFLVVVFWPAAVIYAILKMKK